MNAGRDLPKSGKDKESRDATRGCQTPDYFTKETSGNRCNHPSAKPLGVTPRNVRGMYATNISIASQFASVSPPNID